MSSDTVLRQEIRHSLDDVRSRISNYTGLYPNEDLTRDVLCACDRIMDLVVPDPYLEETRRIIEDRCRRLAEAADRFSDRDPVVIAASRARAVAAIDILQDAIFRLRSVNAPVPKVGMLLRQRSV